MSYPIEPPVTPMLARAQKEIPLGDQWVYEPKWDGFRAICFKDGDQIHIGSRNARPLERYFPELIPELLDALPPRCVIDGEIVIEGASGLDFDALLLRIHPAASRVNMLAAQSPATFVAFDLLADESDRRDEPLSERRKAMIGAIEPRERVFLSPQTKDPKVAGDWFTRFEGAGLDGIVAKEAGGIYQPGERAMIKVKHLRTADCVVGGYRPAKDGEGIGSLLLGLYAGDVLHYVGHTSSFSRAQRQQILEMLLPLQGENGFGLGRTPGGPNRWTQAGSVEWTSVRPDLVCEVSFDHLQGERFRHAATFRRWRPDRDPSSCTFDQLEAPHPYLLQKVRNLSNY